MTDLPSQVSLVPPRRNKGLILIAAYKIGQALLFIALGVGALRLLHKDIQDELTQLIDHLRFNPESKLINFILVQASIIDDHMLRRVSAVLFAYAGLIWRRSGPNTSPCSSQPPSCHSKSSKLSAGSLGSGPVCCY